MLRFEVSTEKITDIEKIREARRELERQITELARNFEQRTLCAITSIDECRAPAVVYWIPRVTIG